MDAIIAFQNVLEALDTFWQESWFMAVLKFFALIYILVVVADIIMLIMLTDIKASMRENLKGTKRPAGKPAKYIKRWETILLRLTTGNVSQYKVAILEADAFAEEVLEALGYHGANMKERLESISPYAIETKADLITGHAVRNRVIQEAGFEPTREEAEEALRYFSNFFRETDIF
jgi:hypothetical protein